MPAWDMHTKLGAGSFTLAPINRNPNPSPWHFGDSTVLGEPYATRSRRPLDAPTETLPIGELLAKEVGADMWRQLDAVHEAAHAVLYMESGILVDHIVLREPPASSRVTCLPGSARGGDILITMAAGSCAGIRYLHEQDLWTAWCGHLLECTDSEDRQEIDRLATENGFAVTLADYGDLLDAAQVALDARWGAVLRVADALADAGRLGRDEVAALVDAQKEPGDQ